MDLPIIVDEHGDLMVFASESELSDYLEPIDVRNGEYIAYDSKGEQLTLLVETEKLRSKILGQTLRERVIVGPRIDGDKSVSLKIVIADYLTKVSVLDSFQELELDQLVRELKNFLKKRGHP